jgi:uncharacterized membrane protein
MLLFVAMMDIPGVFSNPGNRIAWTLAVRELVFGAGGWLLAAPALSGEGKRWVIAVGRVVVGLTAMFYGVEHFIHPLSRPGVPLEGLMPEWIPGRLLIGYLTGAILVAAGAMILLNTRMRLAATVLGGWIVLLVAFIYGPILIALMATPNTGVNVEGLNYFGDTLLFAGVILALARAAEREATD